MRIPVALLLFNCACTDWRERVTPGLTIDPTQTAVDSLPTTLSLGDTSATLTARARYSTKAWVVAVDRDFDDDFEDVMPIDLSLAWGPLGNPEILRSMSFHLARRYVSVRWDRTMPLAKDVVMSHLANHHLVPGSPEIRAYLERTEPGDLVLLEGFLVDVEARGRAMRTSLRRNDIGNGSCEILWVERAEISPRSD